MSWATDKANSVVVTASRMDQEDDGYATGLSNTICKDGQQTTTARIPFALGVSSMAGAVGGVSYAASGDTDTGMYYPGANEVALAAGGVQVLDSTATTLTVPIAFAVTGAATFASTLAVSATVSLGVLVVAGALTASATASVGFLNVASLATFSSTSHMLLPSGTTGQRPSATAAAFRYNSTLGAAEYSNGTVWRPLKDVPTTQVFTSGSSATYTTPSGATWLKIRQIGGGGGGAGSTGTGTDGGDTSFNAIVAKGGKKGISDSGGAGGTSGTGSASVRLTGAKGGAGIITSGIQGGFGAGSPFAGSTDGGGTPPANTGCGGGGMVGDAIHSYGGGGAGEYVEIIITSPSATYTYSVGAAGSAGTGTGTVGAGVAGIIIVEEHYT